jgi:hypothetical protein
LERSRRTAFTLRQWCVSAAAAAARKHVDDGDPAHGGFLHERNAAASDK